MHKDELMQQVWPDTVVEEVNLAHNISMIRKALGQKSEENPFIITVPGRGYGFVVQVTAAPQLEMSSAVSSEDEIAHLQPLAEDEFTRQGRSAPCDAGTHVQGAPRLGAEGRKGTIGRTIGRRGLVSLAGLVGVAIFIAVWLASYSFRTRQPKPFTEIRSIAVLPFKPL